MEPEAATSKDLEEAAGLSRSAALKRCHELCDEGIFVKKIKPGTEKRKYPPYIFSIAPEIKEKLIAFLESELFKDKILGLDSSHTITEHTIEAESLRESQTSEETSKQPIQHTEDLAEISSQDSPKFSGISEIPRADKQQDTQQNIGAILKRMAEEIASLRNRVNQLEQKFEESEIPKTSNDADFEQVLKILESSHNGNLSIQAEQ